MQNGDHIPADASCAFCQRSTLAAILKETPNFLLVADFAPLVEGHLLIIPQQHYACYGEVPAELDAELLALKQEVRLFANHFYAPLIFWEHGAFHQTVFHAHLHGIPFGIAEYDLSRELHSLVVHSQDDIRTWYATSGPYFYLEDSRKALLFAPEMERYSQIVREVLWHGWTTYHGHSRWRTPQQRFEEGRPLIEAMAAKWRSFQQP